jgi:MbtH protein
VSEDSARYRVVVNDEDQYSIWPEHKRNAPGWRDAGFVGGRDECLDHVEQVWHDLRPRSVRQCADRDARVRA